MRDLRFASPEHRDFFLDMMSEARRNDCYHRAFFYVMGIAPETRANIRQMFDFKQDCIEPDGMHGGWQTSGTVRVCRLAFNLWNGYTDPERSNAYSPEDLFCCELTIVSDRFLNLILEQDSTLARQPEMCVDTWLDDAACLAGDDDNIRKLYRRNAAQLITVWGDSVASNLRGLHDYSHREWSGLLRELYYQRWKAFFDSELRGALKPDYYLMETEWVRRREQN